jgi:streptomycin 6-kinase
LTIEPAFDRSSLCYAAPARDREGTRVVVKIQYPHHESRDEAEALRVWQGRGHVVLLDHDAESNTLLLERCEPGTPRTLADPADLHALLASLLRRAFVPAPSHFACLRNEAELWTRELRAPELHRWIDASLLALAIETLTELVDTQGKPVLVNQDLHRDNLLRAKREPWLVIDPKPLAAEPELALANRLPMFGAGELAEGVPGLEARLDRLAADLELDRRRVRAWAFVRLVLWATDDRESAPLFLDLARSLGQQ